MDTQAEREKETREDVDRAEVEKTRTEAFILRVFPTRM
jgi:hypothetical protein